MATSPAKQSYTIAEAAEYLGVSIQSLRRWTDEGKLECWRTPGDQRRFSVETLDKLRQAA
jgi:excisionase family DNA binding protein